MKKELYCEVVELLEHQPFLKVRDDEKEYVINGIYKYSLEFKGYNVEGERKIKFVVPKDFPNIIPTLYVFEYPEGIEHIYEDKSVCLATTGEIINFINSNPSLIAFFNKFVNAFIFTLEWYDVYNNYPFGDRQHGYKGALDYYLNDLNLTKPQYEKMVLMIYNSKYRGHLPCFCGSGKILRRCHGKYVLPILKNKDNKDLFLKEACMIWMKDKKNGK